MRTQGKNISLFCVLLMGAIFFITSQASAMITGQDVAIKVKAAMGTGAGAEDAVKSVVYFAISKGMTAKAAAAAATQAAVEAAVTLRLDINAAIRDAVMGAAAGAIMAGLDINAATEGVAPDAVSAAAPPEPNALDLLINGAVEGACEGAIRAAAAAGADIGVAAYAAVGSSVKAAVRHNQDSALAASSAVSGAVTGAIASRLSFEEITRVISGSAQGANAGAVETGQDLIAIGTGIRSGVYFIAESLGLDSAAMAMVAAAAYGRQDIIPLEMIPRERIPKGPAVPTHEPDQIEPILPDQIASPV